MENQYDVIVVGVGGMGSATAYHLASRNVNVLGLERYDIPHNMGSSHGITRLIRKAQYEDPIYVPLVRRAYELWDNLEERTGRDLLYPTGGLDIGPPDSQIFHGSRQSCETHDIEHEILSGSEVNERFPGYAIPDEHRAVYQPDGGYLVPEECIIAHVEAAQEQGADIRAREPVKNFTPLPNGGVRVTSQKGTYKADRLVVTAGAWVRELLPELADLAIPERQVLAWLQPTAPVQFEPENFPVFVHETDDGHYYGFPKHDVPGFKFGKFNHFEETVDPNEMDRQPRPEDEGLLRAYAERYFPNGAGPTMKLATCMFTNTPDEHFILDTFPEYPQVSVGAGFSGHGFKFASVIGEILADYALDETPGYDVSPFRLSRFN
jgi:sarcosine oxidase